MVETTDQLPQLLQKMVEDIKDPECFYWIYSNYFDIHSPTERNVTRWYHTPLFINYDALWNPEFVEDGLLVDVILKNQLPAEKERIKLEYDQIYSIKRVNYRKLTRVETNGEIRYYGTSDGTIYNKPNRLKFPSGGKAIEENKEG